MKRFSIGALAALAISLMAFGLVWAEFGVDNFRMSDQPGGEMEDSARALACAQEAYLQTRPGERRQREHGEAH